MNRVPAEYIEKLAESLSYKYVNVEDTTITGCYALLPDDFKVGYGESSCVSKSNFDVDLGKKYAKERAVSDAISTLWELEGYVLSVSGQLSETLRRNKKSFASIHQDYVAYHE